MKIKASPATQKNKPRERCSRGFLLDMAQLTLIVLGEGQQTLYLRYDHEIEKLEMQLRLRLRGAAELPDGALPAPRSGYPGRGTRR
jgi:hypothetical protein